VAPGTFKAEKSIARNLVRILGGDVKLTSLADICRIRSYQDARRKENISPKTINNEVQAFASILGLAGLWARVEAHYKPLRVVKSDLPDALTREESTKLLTIAANSHPYEVAPYAAVLAFSTGLQSGEIKGLRLGDLHHEEVHPYLQVRRTTTKTNAGARRVPLGTIAVWAVRKLVARARLLGCTSPEHYLLPTDRARHTLSDDPPCMEHPGLTHFILSPHGKQGRKNSVVLWEFPAGDFMTSATPMSPGLPKRGGPVAVVQSLVGHLSAAMVQHYTHISGQALFEAARRIETQSGELVACLGLQRRDVNGDEGRTLSDGEAVEIVGFSVH
jgi:integrase